jgi:hypothetical protein
VRKKHQAGEIVTKWWQVEVLTAQGRAMVEAVRSIGVTGLTPLGDPVVMLVQDLFTRYPFRGQAKATFILLSYEWRSTKNFVTGRFLL